MLLTDEERKRFVEYLNSEIRSSGSIIEQAEKINLPNILILGYKRDVLAMITIRNRLQNVEVQSIGDGS